MVTAHGQALSSPLTYSLSRVFSLAISAPIRGKIAFTHMHSLHTLQRNSVRFPCGGLEWIMIESMTESGNGMPEASTHTDAYINLSVIMRMVMFEKCYNFTSFSIEPTPASPASNILDKFPHE